ncbi:MAG: hypothetical protein V4574_05995 [Pseudomonadota bacterium]
MKKFALIAAAGSLALALAACGGPKPEEAPVETNVANLAEPGNGAFGNEVTPTPSPEANVSQGPAARGADFADGAQTQDDADATGMTARVSRDDEGNETAPAR